MIDLIPLEEETKRKLEENLNQCREKTAEDIKLVREWIAQQAHLPQEHDDVWLERFLCASKYNVERCKEKLENYYIKRTLFFQKVRLQDPASKTIRETSQVLYRIALPKCTPDGYRVTIFGLLNYDLDKFCIENFLMREWQLITMYSLIESNYGTIVILDAARISAFHTLKIFPHLRNIVSLIQDCIPLRIKQIHFIHVQPFMKKIFTLFTSLLKEKMRNRIHMHTNDFEKLYEFIPRESLPKEFGGQCGTIVEINDAFQKKLETMSRSVTEELKKNVELKNKKKVSRKSFLGYIW